MQIHELNGYSGALDDAYMAVDNGSDTGKKKIKDITDPLNVRIDNIIAGPASSAQEVIDARLGADGITYPSLGDAIRDQITDLHSDLNDIAPTQLNFINANGGNVFDPNAYTVGYISNSGTLYTNASFIVSDFIPVKKGDIIRYTYTDALATQSSQLYDSSKAFVSASTKTTYGTTYQEVTIPSGIAYIRVNLGANGLKVITKNIEYDASLNGSYGWDIEPENNVTIPSVGVDRLNFINVKKNLYDSSTVTNGYISNSGTEYTNASFRYTDFIPVSEGDIIRFTYNSSLYTQSNQYYDGLKRFYTSGSSYTVSEGTLYQKSVVPPGAKYIRINLGADQVSNFVIVKNSDYDASLASNNIQILSLKAGYSFDTSDYIKCNFVDNGCMFNYICCIGDSLTEGEYGADAVTQEYIGIHDGYPHFLARMLNTQTENLGYGGQSTKTWWQLKDQKFTQQQLDFSRYDCFIIFLGTNGGVSGQPDPDDDSMMGYYCKIIDKCRTESPGSAIFLVGFPWSVTRTAQKITDLNTLATAENLPILDLSKSKILTYENRTVNQPFDLALHYGRLGYVRLASEILRCMNEAIETAPSVYAKQIN